jgi:outer membrane lipoprotein
MVCMVKRFIMIMALPLIAMLGVASCAPPFAKGTLEKVDRSISFRELQRDPDTFKGRWVMLAGVIIEARNTKDGTTIEVLQRPMDRRGRPYETDVTEGRFIITTDRFLDAAVYHQGRRIAVVAEVAGQKMLPLGEIEYQYPVVVAKELYLWEPSSGPQFFFGIGVSKGF